MSDSKIQAIMDFEELHEESYWKTWVEIMKKTRGI